MPANESILEIKVLCLDVDGVLTDGRYTISDDGHTSRAFNLQDGFALRWFQELGGTLLICTGKESQNVLYRARELKIEHVIQGSRDKVTDIERLLGRLGFGFDDLAMIGDDLPDIAVLRRCKYPIAVANAVPEVKTVARYVTSHAGGHGAVREAVEHLLRADGRWKRVVDHYGGGAESKG